ncbi:MAG: 3-oxoacyl-ACP reductase FabG [Bacillaceae bacterium]|uniref:3-oxoacyl-[acyl-carrier-protein] reductase n=1 Tax=Alkalihalobacterium chitinilyticum TaxID=2980103 RepID=A0ABT5VAR2_9BACI|nr:3-oxoacyl-ACP reductase FabG [Alkalihalobacterium chitinilyticum]MDE5412536.1 3-oxoacyl-ACP reductase FabG [Alkalihalobacterium chitinilyticum]MEB1806164.1 3-oxoacyl-ACP reductase FabG [Bacillaceae bacterium]
MRLQDKTAIITGAGNGIGKEAALTFSREGANVVVADFDEAAAEAVVAEIKEKGGNGIAIKVNVADQESVTQMVQEAVNSFGSVDILVNNAGITADAMLHKLTPENWQKVIDVNLTGVFYCTQAVIPKMVEQGKGKIITTSSVSGVYGNVGQTNYAATKAGVVGMTKSWAKEFGGKGINVNAVAPGFVETSMVAKVPDKVIEKLKMTIPLNRLGKPADIANAYLFLASDESDYVNGTVIHVDGGIMM